MASSDEGEPVQYLYTPDLEDELYQQNVMLTHPTNVLRLDTSAEPPTGANNENEDIENDYDDTNNTEDDIEVSEITWCIYEFRSFTDWNSSTAKSLILIRPKIKGKSPISCCSFHQMAYWTRRQRQED